MVLVCFIVVNVQPFYRAFLGFSTTESASHYKPHSLIYILMTHQDQLRAQYLAQRHFNMQTGRATDQTLAINGPPAFPTEVWLPTIRAASVFETHISTKMYVVKPLHSF